MNWVAPIKDDTTLEKFKQKLREVDDKYYILFEIGVGTGLQLQEILKFRNKDIRDKDSIEASIGTKNIKRTFQIPQGTQRDHQPVYRRQRSGGLSDPRTFRFTGTAFQRTGLPRI